MRNTVDAKVYVGGSDWIAVVTEVLSASIAGSATVTNEPFLGQEDEAASAHAAMVTIALASMYDGAVTDTLRDHIGEAANIAIVTDENFECYPLDVPNLPQTASVVAPITSEFSMAQGGRGRFGSSTTAFALTQSANTVTIDLTGVETVHVIVSELSSTLPTQLRFTEGSDNQSIPIAVGIHEVAIPTAMRASGATLNINSASNVTASGYLLIGSAQPLANGAT